MSTSSRVSTAEPPVSHVRYATKYFFQILFNIFWQVLQPAAAPLPHEPLAAEHERGAAEGSEDLPHPPSPYVQLQTA